MHTISSIIINMDSDLVQLMLLVDDILKAMESHYQVDMVLLNFSKVFDTVAHNEVLLKVTHYGIRSNIHNWKKF